jgi:hypothetical protein
MSQEELVKEYRVQEKASQEAHSWLTSKENRDEFSLMIRNLTEAETNFETGYL